MKRFLVLLVAPALVFSTAAAAQEGAATAGNNNIFLRSSRSLKPIKGSDQGRQQKNNVQVMVADPVQQQEQEQQQEQQEPKADCTSTEDCTKDNSGAGSGVTATTRGNRLGHYTSTNNNEASSTNNNMMRIYQDDDEADLDDVEVADLRFVREEVKMARDLCQEFYEKYQAPIFQTMAATQQDQMDLVEAKMDMENIVVGGNNDVGVFSDPAIQKLYNEFCAEAGEQGGLAGALKVTAKVQERAMSDLGIAMEEIRSGSDSKPGLHRLYADLESGSRNQLRAMVNALENLGEGPYKAQYLNQYDVDVALDKLE